MPNLINLLAAKGRINRAWYLLAFAAIFAATLVSFKITDNFLGNLNLAIYAIFWIWLGGALVVMRLRDFGAPVIFAAVPVCLVAAGIGYSYAMWRGLVDSDHDLGVVLPFLAGSLAYVVAIVAVGAWPGKNSAIRLGS